MAEPAPVVVPPDVDGDEWYRDPALSALEVMDMDEANEASTSRSSSPGVKGDDGGP